jgi:hypothetical protein
MQLRSSVSGVRRAVLMVVLVSLCASGARNALAVRSSRSIQTPRRRRLRAVRSAPVSSRPEVVCQVFFAVSIIEASSGEPRRLSALR